MRILFFISLLFLSNSAWSQPWQDALKNARESYVSKAYEQSALHYQRAQKLAPKNIDLSVELAQSLYKAGKYEEAEKLYNSQVAKSRGKISNSDIQRQLGDSRMHQQKYDQAIEAYKSSLRANPSDDVARHNLAKAIQQKQEKDKQEKNQNQPNQNPPNSKDQNPKPEEDNQQSSQKQNQNRNSPSPKEQESKENTSLSDKRAERLLEELTKKEKETKRQMNSKIDDKSKSRNQVKKDW